MKLERDDRDLVRLTAHPYELATLISAARWAARSREEGLDGDAGTRLRALLAQYDEQVRRLNGTVTRTGV